MAHIDTSVLRRWIVRLALGLGVLLLLLPVSAQDAAAPLAPQFLYRRDNRLLLLDGYTGKPTVLPFFVSQGDRFTWSPDGQWILWQQLTQWNHGYNTSCIMLYHVDSQTWYDDGPIVCNVNAVIFAQDGRALIYAEQTESRALLWRYDLSRRTRNLLYTTPDGSALLPISISNIVWSPTGRYLTWIQAELIMGGSVNTLFVMRADTLDIITVNAPDSYYAYYDPIWSADDQRFLIVLLEEYTAGGGVGFTNHRGDVYLVEIKTNTQTRLSYTPASPERDITWTVDGGINFTTTTLLVEQTTLTLEEARAVPSVAYDDMIRPSSAFEITTSLTPVFSLPSPDPNYGAWVMRLEDGDELRFGRILGKGYDPVFAIALPRWYREEGILVGWRPGASGGYGAG